MKNESRFQLQCQDGCGIIEFEYLRDERAESLYVTYWVRQFHARKIKVFRVIKNRISAAWMMLRGKEYQLFDIVIENEKIIEFKKWVNEE